VNERLNQVKDQLLGVWGGFGRGQKVSIGVLALVTIAVAAGLMIWAQMPDYTTLYTGLNEQDAGAVVTKLKDSKVDYKLGDGGTSILVPSAQVAQTRLDLASAGLPNGGTTGFELFDKTNFGMTDFTQRLNYQRALEGELTRTIQSLTEVDSARVHIVTPEPSIYSDDQQAATASVVLKLKSGSQLSQKQIKGVAHLVAGAVEGLKPENMTIVDTNGNILSDGVASADGMNLELTGSQMELQNQFEKNTAQSVQALLDRVLGPSKSAVRVSAQLDWDTYQANNETYNPNKGQSQVLSSHTITETSGTAGGAAGIPGVDSNIPGYQQTVTNTNTSGYARQETTNNYEVSKITETISRAPGAVKKLSVAVILDSQVSQQQLTNLKQAISAAVGVDSVRGDTLTITSMPFDQNYIKDQEKAMADAQQEEMIFNGARIAGMVLVPILVLLFLRFLFKPKKAKKGKKGKGEVDLPQIPERMSMSGSSRQGQLATAMVPPEHLLMEGQRRRMMQQQVGGLARQQPAAIAQVIQTWLAEDEEKR
jgi:flagellar M-ring protein FliF